MPLSAGGRNRKRGTARTVLLTVLALLAIASGMLAWRFREEIKAFGVSRQYSTKELEDQLAGNDQTIRDAVEASSDVTVRAPTDEEREALRDGSLTQEELIDRLTGSNAATEPKPPAEQTGTAADPAKPDSAKPTGNQPVPDKPEKPAETKPEPTAEQKDYQKKLSALVAQVYVLREEYVGALEDMEAAAEADYNALPESQRTSTKLAPLVSDYLARATGLEKECDGRMDGIIAEMEKLIKENNGDMSLTDTVFNTYVNEKSLKKAWYLSRLQEKGLI